MTVFVVFLTLVSLSLTTAYLLGFRLGEHSSLDRLRAVEDEALRASRRMHELTRSAFTAMAEEVDRRRGRL